MKSLSASRFHYIFTVCFENSAWIHFFRQITMNPLSASNWIHYRFREFTICFAYWLLNRYFFVNSLYIKNNFRGFGFNMNFPWIHYCFRDITMSSLSATRFYYEFSIYFANSVRIHYRFRKITLKSLCLSLIHLESTILFAKSLSINYRLHDCSLNSLSFSRIHLGSNFSVKSL